MIEFEYGNASYIGDREYQEDECRYELLTPSKISGPNSIEADTAAAVLAVLADGMGGHTGGALASQTAIEAFIEIFKQVGSSGENTLARNRKQLHNAIVASNNSIASKVQNDIELDGMGCTLVGVRFDRRGMLWISVGDSPLYLYRDGKIVQSNQDHSLAPMLDRLVERHELTTYEANNHPQRNALHSAVTGADIKLVDNPEKFFPLKSGDWIVLASDGIQTMSTAQIAESIRQHRMNGAQAVADALIEAVRKINEPYQDNTTIMVIAPYKVDKKTNRRQPPAEPPLRPYVDDLLMSRLPIIGGVMTIVALVVLVIVVAFNVIKTPDQASKPDITKPDSKITGKQNSKPMTVPAQRPVAGGKTAEEYKHRCKHR